MGVRCGSRGYINWLFTLKHILMRRDHMQQEPAQPKVANRQRFIETRIMMILISVWVWQAWCTHSSSSSSSSSGYSYTEIQRLIPTKMGKRAPPKAKLFPLSWRVLWFHADLSVRRWFVRSFSGSMCQMPKTNNKRNTLVCCSRFEARGSTLCNFYFNVLIEIYACRRQPTFQR